MSSHLEEESELVWHETDEERFRKRKLYSRAPTCVGGSEPSPDCNVGIFDPVVQWILIRGQLTTNKSPAASPLNPPPGSPWLPSTQRWPLSPRTLGPLPSCPTAFSTPCLCMPSLKCFPAPLLHPHGGRLSSACHRAQPTVGS